MLDVRFLTSWKYLKNKAASFVALSSGKVKIAVRDFGQQRPVETGAPNKFAKLGSCLLQTLR